MNATSPPAGPGPQLPSRRERKKRATREALRRAAVELTEQRGLVNVTVESITDAADVAPRTFFNYFSSKEDAVLGHQPERLERVQAQLRDRPAGEGALASLRAVVCEYLTSEDIVRGDLLRMMRLVKAEPQLRAAQAARWEEMERVMVAAVAERCHLDPVEDLYPAVVVGAGVAAVRASVMRWCDHQGQEPLADFVSEAVDLVAAGLDRQVPGRRRATG